MRPIHSSKDMAYSSEGRESAGPPVTHPLKYPRERRHLGWSTAEIRGLLSAARLAREGETETSRSSHPSRSKGGRNSLGFCLKPSGSFYDFKCREISISTKRV